MFLLYTSIKGNPNSVWRYRKVSLISFWEWRLVPGAHSRITLLSLHTPAANNGLRLFRGNLIMLYVMYRACSSIAQMIEKSLRILARAD